LLLYGNAYALVVRSGGRPVALWPLHPTRVHLDDQDGVFTYKVSSPGGVEQYPPEDIVHVPILAPDGVRGQSPVTLAREAIGAALAAEEHAALYFANGAQPSGVLVHPGQLSPEAAQRLRESWRAAHGGRNRGGTAVLEGGMEYKPISNTAKDAQLIEARQFAMRLLAAAMRIPPHLLDPSVRGAYANVETQSLEFLTFSLAAAFDPVRGGFHPAAVHGPGAAPVLRRVPGGRPAAGRHPDPVRGLQDRYPGRLSWVRTRPGSARTCPGGDSVGKELETRSWPFAAELRQEGEQPVLVGYAVRWGEVSEPLPFRERFLPGAFAKDLASGRDVLALVGHELSKVLARRSNGTLTLREDEVGLWVEIRPQHGDQLCPGPGGPGATGRLEADVHRLCGDGRPLGQ